MIAVLIEMCQTGNRGGFRISQGKPIMGAGALQGRTPNGRSRQSPLKLESLLSIFKTDKRLSASGEFSYKR